MNVLAELRQVLIQVEIKTAGKIRADSGIQTDTGVWIERFILAGTQVNTVNTEVRPAEGGAPPGGAPPPDKPPGSVINIRCRAVDLSRVSPSAKQDIVFALQGELKTCPLFDPAGTELTDPIAPDEATGTFTFGATLALKQPLKF